MMMHYHPLLIMPLLLLMNSSSSALVTTTGARMLYHISFTAKVARNSTSGAAANFSEDLYSTAVLNAVGLSNLYYYRVSLTVADVASKDIEVITTVGMDSSRQMRTVAAYLNFSRLKAAMSKYGMVLTSMSDVKKIPEPMDATTVWLIIGVAILVTAVMVCIGAFFVKS